MFTKNVMFCRTLMAHVRMKTRISGMESLLIPVLRGTGYPKRGVRVWGRGCQVMTVLLCDAPWIAM